MAGSQHDIPPLSITWLGGEGGGEVTLPGGKWRTAPYTPEQTIEHKIYHKKFPHSSQYTHCLFPPPSTPPLFCLSFMFSRKMFCSFFHLAKKDLSFSSSFFCSFFPRQERSLTQCCFLTFFPSFFLSFSL
jgi:hypothetical protein